MLLIIKFLSKVIAMLNGETSSRQIGYGFAYGSIIGFLPASGLMPYVMLLLAFIINFNLPAVFLAAAMTKIQSFFVDPMANAIGYFLLVKMPFLKGFWTTLYNMPVVPFTRFNNTIVLGSLVIGVLSFIPNYFFAKKCVELYRAKLRDKVLKFKIVQVIKASSFYKYYESFRGLKGE